jgi:spermidine synthase
MNWLSFITAITLYTGKTRDGEVIEVKEVRGKRYMYIGGYSQSAAKYVSAWKYVFKKALLDELPDKAQVLLLGLGGGDIVKILKKQKPSWSLTAVEIEDAVVDAAKEYFNLRESKNLKIVVADADNYIKTNKRKYDLVIVDLYMGDKVPIFVTSAEFLQNIRKAKKNNGTTLFNYASHNFKDDDFKKFELKLSCYFPVVKSLKRFGHSFYLAR